MTRIPLAIPASPASAGILQEAHKIEAVVNSYMEAVEEIINVSDLIRYFTEVVQSGHLGEVMEEIVTQSKVEFNYNDDEDEDSALDDALRDA